MFLVRTTGNGPVHYLIWRDEYTHNSFGMAMYRPTIGWVDDIDQATQIGSRLEAEDRCRAMPPGSVEICGVRSQAYDIASPEPPWPVGTDHNAKREGWKAFFDGQPRTHSPFPPARDDLRKGFEEGWDVAKGTNSAMPKANG